MLSRRICNVDKLYYQGMLEWSQTRRGRQFDAQVLSFELLRDSCLFNGWLNCTVVIFPLLTSCQTGARKSYYRWHAHSMHFQGWHISKRKMTVSAMVTPCTGRVNRFNKTLGANPYSYSQGQRMNTCVLDYFSSSAFLTGCEESRGGRVEHLD